MEKLLASEFGSVRNPEKKKRNIVHGFSFFISVFLSEGKYGFIVSSN